MESVQQLNLITGRVVPVNLVVGNREEQVLGESLRLPIRGVGYRMYRRPVSTRPVEGGLVCVWICVDNHLTALRNHNHLPH